MSKIPILTFVPIKIAMTDTVPATKNPPSTKLLKVLAMVAIVCGVGWLFYTDDKPHDNDDGTTTQEVIYDVANWQGRSIIHSESDKFEQIKSILGSTATTSETLDFDGRKADKYSYTSASEPPLYVIESDDVFELAWYFASPNDSDRIKANSMTYAKKGHEVATALYGDDGKSLIEQMLDKQTIAPEFLEVHRLRYAGCQDYTCRLIIQK